MLLPGEATILVTHGLRRISTCLRHPRHRARTESRSRQLQSIKSTQIDPKSSQNRPRIIKNRPKSTPNHQKSELGAALGAPGAPTGPILGPPWGRDGKNHRKVTSWIPPQGCQRGSLWSTFWYFYGTLLGIISGIDF